VAEPPPSPAVLHAQLNATTSSSDKRLIVLSLHVSGAQRPIRALLDSGATNNFVRAESLSVLPRDLQVREGPGSMVVKYADGKPRQLPRRSVKFAYSFDDFYGDDDFLVIDLSGSFDCVFGMPWLSRHQPNVDWLNRTVRPRDIDVHGELAFLWSSTNNNLWPHVAVMDPDSMTLAVHEESDGPSCAACNSVTCADPSLQRQLDPRIAEEQRPPHENNAIEQRLPLANEAVERRLPLPNEAVEQGLPHPDVVVEQWPPRQVKTKRRKQKNWRGRLGLRSNHVSDSEDEELDIEVLNVIEHSDTEYHRRQLRVANPPKAAAVLTKLPSMSCKRFLKDLKRGEIERVCVLTAEAPSGDAPPDPTVNSVASSVSDTPGKHERPESAEPQSARAERFASQSWEALQAWGNPVYALAREYEDVFSDKIPATLPADRGVQHEIDLVPGAKYCVTRQWPLPRDQV
jgi:hypothetical protein